MMGTAAARSLLAGFLSVFLLLFLHLGCSCFSPAPTTAHEQPLPPPPRPKRRRKISPLFSSPPSSSSSNDARHPTPLSLASIRSYLSSIFSFRRPPTAMTKEFEGGEAAAAAQISSPISILFPTSPLEPAAPSPRADSAADAGGAADHPKKCSVFPCSACGEVLARAHLLELHQATKHALSELPDAPESGRNIVRIIFLSGWPRDAAAPSVRRILKIHHSQRALARFEEYRDVVRSRAAAAARRSGRAADERCIADGNERLRFYCTTALCALGSAGTRGACGSPYCCACGIVRHGFAGKQADLDGIATYASGWGAHSALPAEVEREFAFLQVRRAMLVCRVIAGRVARGEPRGREEAEQLVEGEKAAAVPAFDSVVPGGPPSSSAGEVEEGEELLVFNPRAVLPCFVILYTA